MFIISDDYPQVEQTSSEILINDLIKNIKILEHNKIEVIGIGIDSKFGENIYSKFFNIHKVSDLVNVGIRKFEQILIKR